MNDTRCCFASDPLSVLIGSAVVNSAIDPRHGHALRKFSKGADRYNGIGFIIGKHINRFTISQRDFMIKNGGQRRPVRAMGSWILRMHRRAQKWGPVLHDVGINPIIKVSIPDRGFRAPELEMVLGREGRQTRVTGGDGCHYI